MVWEIEFLRCLSELSDYVYENIPRCKSLKSETVLIQNILDKEHISPVYSFLIQRIGK